MPVRSEARIGMTAAASNARPTNWSGNVRFSAARVHSPTDVDELSELVTASERVKVLGTGHSFSDVADTTGDLIVTDRLPVRMDLDESTGAVTVSASVRFAELATLLDERGRALHNLGSLPHISVIGASCTGTHGSGDGNQALAAAVRALEFVRPDGSLQTVGGEDLAGQVVNLGALGIVTAATLATVPRYEIEQYVYDDLPDAALLENLGEIFAAGHSVSVFTRWTGTSAIWLKRRAGGDPPPGRWLGARLADDRRVVGPGLDPASHTEQLGVPGPWHARLPHFRAEFRPSWGEELQSEFFVDREAGADAIAAVRSLADVLAPALFVSELRTIAADDLWLSPAYGRDTLGLHFTWHKDERAVAAALPAVEARLREFDARPHWGKVFTMAPGRVREVHPRVADFADLARRTDPQGRFRNAFLDRYFT
jgi:xylitol oxidase